MCAKWSFWTETLRASPQHLNKYSSPVPSLGGASQLTFRLNQYVYVTASPSRRKSRGLRLLARKGARLPRNRTFQ